MPRRNDIQKVLVIGSGPIVIGQAAEFDYAGTQACKALKEEGYTVVLVNSNPATIMTDKNMADKIYIEPLTLEVVKKIIAMERPDSVLPTLGGQTGLNLAMELAEQGYLEEMGVKLLGAKPLTIKKAEDRQAFKDTMEAINQPCIASKVVENLEDALAFADEIGYPVIIRPAYTLGGTGGGIAYDVEMMKEIGESGLRASRVHQILVEKCISGWKEIEYEVMRDSVGNAITICSMENVDPVGVHTGDSIVVAPAQTLSTTEAGMLRNAALNIITALDIEGGCNVQFALEPNSLEYAVIEVNPRVSRSSALASKATGYPIAKVASKIAVGYTLDEIKNAVTGETYACFEPTVDYCVLKFPKWPFDKFVYAKRTLGTQMKATGEVMSIGSSFESAMMKAVRSIELGLDRMAIPVLAQLSDEEIEKRLYNVDDERMFVVCEAIRRGIPLEKIHEITMIDLWFLGKYQNLIRMENKLAEGNLTEETYVEAKKMGFLDSTIEALSKEPLKYHRRCVYKMVDTCGGEFDAKTPYYYSTYDEENEARTSDKKKVIVFGSGPIRIGQGIEFDYASVHCVWALKKLGYETIIANNNPETVSTDFDTADRLYFEPLTKEDVRNIIETEQPEGVIVQFGGQTAIKLTKYLSEMGVKIFGTSADMIDAAEDRERFDEVLENCGIPRPAGTTVFTVEEGLKAGNELGYPVLVRPSYVLGGQGMAIAFNDKDMEEYINIINKTTQEHPILVDKYLMGKEVEVDAICDGENILIPGIMEHLERAGVHSGDSISVYPSQTLSKRIKDIICDYTYKLSKELQVLGLVNIQYVVYNDEVYVIEVNPRSSRTVPYISKVTNVNMVEQALRCMMGYKLTETGLHPEGDYVAIKVPVFSFEKLHDVDTQLGPEMKSTGEVLGIGHTFDEALLKGLTAAGYKMKTDGVVVFSVRDSDKQEIIPLAEKFEKLGFKIYATAGTALKLNQNMVAASTVKHISGGEPNILTMIQSNSCDYVISTSKHGRQPQLEGVQIRRKTVEHAVPCLTALDTVGALLKCIEMKKKAEELDMFDINEI